MHSDPREAVRERVCSISFGAEGHLAITVGPGSQPAEQAATVSGGHLRQYAVKDRLRNRLPAHQSKDGAESRAAWMAASRSVAYLMTFCFTSPGT